MPAIGRLQVSTQGLGCMGMSEFYGPTDEDQARQTLDTALEIGVNFFDTADMYGYGRNEEFLASFFGRHREEVVIATKFGNVRDRDNPSRRGIRGDKEYIDQAIEASLRRLQVDSIDLYYMHRRDPRVEIEETVGAMADLVRRGLVREIGLSEVTGEELRRAHAVHPIAAVQQEWSVFTRDLEQFLVPAAVELGVAVVPYSPLGRGFLSGAIRPAAKLPDGDFRASLPRFAGAAGEHNYALLAPMYRIADDHGITLAQVALAWLHHQSAVWNLPVIPIPGTRSPERLRENFAAADIRLTAAEYDALEPLAAQVQGDRYADMGTTATVRT